MLLTSHQTNKAKRPKHFRPLKKLQAVEVVETPGFAQTKKKITGVKGKGIRYEKKAVSFLNQQLGEPWLTASGTWFAYQDIEQSGYAQTDWVGYNPEERRIIIAEMKLTRVPKAWWQLNRLYLPLMKFLFTDWEIALLEVTSQIKAISIPEDVKVIHTVDKIEPGRTQVMRVPYG